MPRPNIPAAALEALKQAGIADVAIMTCIDKNGKIHHLKGDAVKDHSDTASFPIATTAIKNITSISIVEHTGSNCITYVMGGALFRYCW